MQQNNVDYIIRYDTAQKTPTSQWDKLDTAQCHAEIHQLQDMTGTKTIIAGTDMNDKRLHHVYVWHKSWAIAIVKLKNT